MKIFLHFPFITSSIGPSSACFNRILINCQFKVISISLPRMPSFSVQIKRIQIQLNSVTSSGYMRGAVCLDHRPLLERARVFINARLRHESAHVKSTSRVSMAMEVQALRMGRACTRTMTHLQRRVSTHSEANGLNGRHFYKDYSGGNSVQHPTQQERPRLHDFIQPRCCWGG